MKPAYSSVAVASSKVIPTTSGNTAVGPPVAHVALVIGSGNDAVGTEARGSLGMSSAPGTRSGTAIALDVNGRPRQASTLGKLIWSVPEIIEHLSKAWTLAPGDLIFTGTPEGVAAVEVGDTLNARIDGVGTLALKIVAR